MKVFLWQQFGSNHSAGFTILGQFETVEKAQEAETIFKTLLEAIQEARGCDINADEEDFVSWPEHEAGQKYGIQWDQSIDWIGDEMSKHVVRFERNVFVTTALSDTWHSSQPISELMKRLTNEIYLERDMEDEVLLTILECHCPDEKIGQEIVDEIRLYLTPKTNEFAIPPWEVYSAVLDMPYSVTEQKQGIYRQIMNAPYSQKLSIEVFQRVIQALYEYQRSSMENRPVDSLVKNAVRQRLSLENAGYKFSPVMGEDELRLIIRDIGGIADTKAQGGKIERAGLVIRIPEIAFWRTQYGLPALIEYLKSKGCHSITYSFLSLPYSLRREYL